MGELDHKGHTDCLVHFDMAPLAIWVENFSGTKEFLDDIGTTDERAVRDYFARHPGLVQDCAARLKVIDINKHTLRFFRVDSKEELLANLQAYFTNGSLAVLREELIVLACGKRSFDGEAQVQTACGDRKTIFFRMQVAPGHEQSLARVYFYFIDITEKKKAELALAASEERFRYLAENSTDLIWEFDENEMFTYVSPRIRTLLGYEPHEVIGRSAYDLMPESERDRVAREFSPVKAARQPFSKLENVNQHKSGRQVVLESSGVPIIDGQGGFRGYRGIDRDVTTEKTAARTLREKEEFYRTLANNLPGVVYRIDAGPPDRMRFINRTSKSITGYEEHELSGDETGNFEDRIHPEDLAGVQLGRRQAIAARRPFTLQYRFLHKDGEYRHFLENGMPVFEQGKPVHIDGVIQDISLQKRAERNLRESEKQLQTIMETVMDAIVTINRDGTILSFNRAAEKIFGYSPEKVLGRNITMLMPEALSDRHETKLSLYLSKKREFVENRRIETEARRKGGEIFPCELSISAARLHGATQFVGVLRDISEAKALREKLEHMATIDKLTGIFNRQKLEEIFALELHRSKRYGRPLCCIYFDIDHFKQVNDTLGHHAGDVTLQEMVLLIAAHIRASDSLGRWGGEEFIIIAPETALKDALRLAELLRRQVEQHAFSQVEHLTISFGVSQYRPDEMVDRFINRADDALYLAKKKGRNRVEQEA